MTGRTLIILPSRGRPWQALEAIASIKKTAKWPDWVDVVVCEDADDTDRFTFENSTVNTVIGRRQRFVQWVNCIAISHRTHTHSHVAWIGDDCRILTQNWDEILYSHPQLVVYGKDGIHDERMATHPFVRTEIPKALGWLIPPDLVHLCADLFIQELGKQLGSIVYDPNLRIEHLHWSVGRSVKDKTYEESDALAKRDGETYHNKILPMIPELAKKVRTQIAQWGAWAKQEPEKSDVAVILEKQARII